ncbi:hypothetical protein V2I01_35320 [Micromonospora sp. BRA006-A]|nr:hypothetical protein [Micromonospora sp. BRA006-A]
MLDSPDCTPRERCTAAARLAELLLHLGRYAEAGDQAREALALAAEVPGTTSEVVMASAALGFSEAFLEDPAAGLAVMRRALDTAERSGRPEDVACAYLHLAELLTGPLNILEEGWWWPAGAPTGSPSWGSAAPGRPGCWRWRRTGCSGWGSGPRRRRWSPPRCGTVPPGPTRSSCCWPVPALRQVRRRRGVRPRPGGGGDGAGRRRSPARTDAHPARRPGHVAGPARPGPAGGAAGSDREPLRRRDRAGHAGLARAARGGRGGGRPDDRGGPQRGTPAARGGRPGDRQERQGGRAGAVRRRGVPRALRRRAEPARRRPWRPGAVGAFRARRGTGATTPTRRRTRGCGRPRRCWPAAAGWPPPASCCTGRTRWPSRSARCR